MNSPQIRISGIINDSIVDGPGLRLTIFAQGCLNNCTGCHNRHTHDLNGGRVVFADEIIEQINKNVLLDGITLSGGEPFLQAKQFEYIAEYAQNNNLSVIAYSGFDWEELVLKQDCQRLIRLCDYIVDGKYKEDLRSLELNFKGSSNQRIIDVKKSINQLQACVIEQF